MRPIDADALDFEKDDLYTADGEGIYAVRRGSVKAAPTLDVASVRHGKWIPHQPGDVYACSLCRFGVLASALFQNRNCINAMCVDNRFNFCPNCGAQMDGGKEKTRADRIRSMTDEELASELMTWRIETCMRLNGAESPYPHTQKTILAWLKQPYEGGTNDEQGCSSESD